MSGLAFVALPPAPASATPVLGALAGAGERPGATRLPFYAGDSALAQVDVGSGNLLVSVKALALPDVNGQLQFGATYNSAVGMTDTTLPRLGGRGWSLDYTDDVRMVAETSTPTTSAVTYRAPGGLVGVFTPASGTGTTANPMRYTAPAGFKSVLTYDTTGYTLVDSETQQTRLFSTTGLLTGVKDRNGNTTSSTTTGTGGSTVTVRTAASTLEPSTAVVNKTSSTTTTIKQGSATTLRTTSFTTQGETIRTFTDALGRDTTFSWANTTGTGAGKLINILAPGGVSVYFDYDSAGRVVSVNQNDRTVQDNITRFAYTTVGTVATTYVADATTNQATAVASVPHTTYTLDPTQRVTKIVDAEGRVRSQTYTPDFDTATATTGAAGVGVGASTTTNTYGANTGQSLTKTTSSTGAAQSLSYATSSGPAAYLPTGSTDDAGNASVYTYNGPGNQLTSTTAGSAQSTATYNTDGTVATATSPGNGTNVTTYGYTNKQLTSITPVTGTSLGNRALTYDSMGRLRTSTNGRGITTTYSYDALDRPTEVAFSDGTGSVTYGYDLAGRLDFRDDVPTQTTWYYDDLGRLTSRHTDLSNTTMTYSYDKASRLTRSATTYGGTITYGYDLAGLPTTITYPASGVGGGTGTEQMVLTYDSQARLTSTTLDQVASGAYAARANYTYDSSGRVAGVTATTSATTGNVIDLAYCHTAGTTYAATSNNGCTATPANDRNKLVWRKDKIQGSETAYTYDTSGRVTGASNDYGNTRSYSYDTRNNRTTASPVPGTSAGTQTLSFNAANQITSTGYTYDGAGNLTNDPSSGATNIGYTAADQLKTLTKNGTTYTYKHAGASNNELVEQTTPDGSKVQYTYGRTNPQGLPIIEETLRTTIENGQPVPYSTSFINNPVTGQPLVQRTDSGLQNMYVYDGAPGAPIALLTSSGEKQAARRYDPYGTVIVTDASTEALDSDPFTFGGTGVRNYATGWIHYGARYYSPVTGTFTQQDTIDAPLDPLNANRYAFAGGDPINNIDPAGAFSLSGALKAGSKLVGRAAKVGTVVCIYRADTAPEDTNSLGDDLDDAGECLNPLGGYGDPGSGD